MQSNNTHNSIQEALSMYKENVSPSETHFQAILSQIPEQQNLKEGRAIRSPYRWLAVTHLITVCALVLMLAPNDSVLTPSSDTISANPYYEIDNQIASFEAQIDADDWARLSSQ
jgi:hypothetical protein